MVGGLASNGRHRCGTMHKKEKCLSNRVDITEVVAYSGPPSNPNLWLSLVSKETSNALEDLLLPHTATFPYTRMRRFAGTNRYIDTGIQLRTA